MQNRLGVTARRWLAAAGLVWTGLAAAAGPTPEEVAAESAKANAFFDRVFDERLARNPEWQTSLGLRANYDRWNDDSPAAAAEALAHTAASLAELQRTIRFEALDAPTRISYRLFVRTAERQIEGYRWRDHNYPVNQLFGVHTGAPALLINRHAVESESDARAYIARLRGLEDKIGQLIAGLERRERAGIVAPRFVHGFALAACRALLRGEPFDDGPAPSTLWEDFQRKVGALEDLPAATLEELRQAGRAALVEAVGPAYRRLEAFLVAQEQRAPEEGGLAGLPDGAACYAFLLREQTTTRLTPDEVHEIGRRAAERLLGELDEAARRAGFAGDRAAFFRHLREDPRFYLADTPEAREAYLGRVRDALGAMQARLPGYFGVLPRAELVVRPVEAFRERGAPQAFYERPTPDGRKPGVYYVNFGNLAALPLHQLETVAFHEGVPGHHLQIALATEQRGLPKFRRFGAGFTAYSEGWGLYAERLAKEMGFFTDPYSDAGRIALELLRAARLVADTGIHARGWTRAEAVAWLAAHTPVPVSDLQTEADRYVVLPAQATTYLIGQERLLELRARARAALGERFDLRDFHDLLLANGAVPLDVLEELVGEWVDARRGSPPVDRS